MIRLVSLSSAWILRFDLVSLSRAILVCSDSSALRMAPSGRGMADTVLIDSGHYRRNWGKPGWLTNYPGLSREAAEYIFGCGAINIGQDAPSIDCAHVG
jgi:kynurenine formamidase